MIKLESGMMFGYLRVIKEAERRAHLRYVLCRCICGKKKEVALRNLTTGASRSCGCRRIRHGESNTPLYKEWAHIKTKHRLRMYPEWHDFLTFKKDTGQSYSDGAKLKRFGGTGPYSKDNCYWLSKTAKETPIEKKKVIPQKDYPDRMQRLIAQFDSIYHEGWSKANQQKVYDHMGVHGYRDPATLLNHIADRSYENLTLLRATNPLNGIEAEWITAKDIEQRSGVPARAIGRALTSVGIYSHRKLFQDRKQRIYYVEDIQKVLNNL